MSPRSLSWLGMIGFVAGLLGAASALVLLLWPPQVADDVVSYPFTSTGFRVVQVWFFVQHLGLLVLLVGLARSRAMGTGRSFGAAAWLAVAGMIALSATELLAMRYADWDFDTANAGVMGTAYGIACTAVGAGMLVVGIGVLRCGRWSGWHRWTPIAVGVGLFVVVTPGLFAGFVAARLVIGFWMVQFAALGWSLHAETATHELPSRAGPATASRRDYERTAEGR
ncbi:MAG TPA: hypothetical protein VIW24_15325 [Aldersonia sp.]